MTGVAVDVVTPFGRRGGAERWLRDLVTHAPGDVAWRVLALEEGPFVADLRALGLSVDVRPTGASAAAVAAAVPATTRWLRARPGGVVLANGVKAAAVATPAARLARRPVVWAKHDFARDASLARPLGRLVHRVVAVSPAVAVATGRDDVVLAPPAASVVPEPREVARRFWHDRGVSFGDAPVLGMVARLVPLKGIDRAVVALARPGAGAWRLVVVGGDDPSAPGHRAELVATAERLGVADRVALVGAVPDAARWLAAFDAVAVLTRVTADGFGREGFGLAALEALRAGVPVIAADGNPEAVRLARGGGQVVPADDPDAVAAALASLPPMTRGERARLARTVADHPTPHDVAARVVGVLADLAPGVAVPA